MNLEILVELMVFGMHEDRYRNRDMHVYVGQHAYIDFLALVTGRAWEQ